ncbi:importin subunit beta-4 [[Candida] anglica]|uniref:Importin subunit beta-4 n=1 Tax=[Candida] anglica TaxID=148631 RepID=A0ABP0EHT5_9ASCO
MDAQYISSLEETLKQTMVPDSAVIKQAATRLTKEFYTSPLALPSLLHILQTSNEEQVQQLAAVEARKLIISQWEKVDGSLKPQIRDAMLQTAFTQQSKRIRHAAARVVASIGEIDIDLEDNQWPDLLPVLVKSVNEAPDLQTKEMAVYTLYTLLETQIPSLVPHVADFLTLFASLLQDQSSQEIRVNAVLAMDVVSQFIDEDVEINTQLAGKFQAAVPSMVNVLKEVITNDDSEKAKDIFNVFNNLIFVDTKLVGDHLIAMVQLTTEIALNSELDEEYRVFALQFLISTVSLRKSKILAAKAGPSLAQAAVRIASEEIDVDEELNTEDDENENEENSPVTLGLRLIAMLSAELPPSQVILPVLENAQAMLGSNNMFERRAALLAIGVGSTGAPDFFATQVNKIVPLLERGLQDPEIVVRVAALRCLAQLTTELQDNIAKFHQELLPHVMAIIDNASSIKAYKYGCVALDGLIEYMSHDAIGQYLEGLMHKLLQMLHSAESSTLKSAVVSAIGSAAYAAGKGFTPYFTGSVQILEPFITNASQVEGMTEDDIELRAMTFENISTMARAVGSETFSQYATPLVEAAYTSLSSEHSRIRESGFAFITNMAKVYGAEFAGFLERIVPEILKCLEQEEFTFNDVGDFEAEDDDEDDDDNKFNVHTGITIEKEIASVALAELASGTGKQFAPYVEQSLKVLGQQIEESYGMREACMNAMWKISISMFKAQYGEEFKAPKGVPAQPYVDSSILQIIQQVREVSVSSLEEEFDLTMVACILDNMAEAIHQVGSVAVINDANDTAVLEKLCVQLMLTLKNEHPCQVDDEEAPADEEEDTSESDALLFETTLEVLVALALALEGDFAKIFTSFKDSIVGSTSTKSKTKRVSATGALAEIASGLKGANPYSQELLQVFTEKLANDKSLEVRGNAAYGVGIIIEHSTTDLSGVYGTVLQLLFQLLNKTERREDRADDEESMDVVNRSYANASGCVARMALKNQQAVPLEHVVGPLLSHLPLETGLEENVPIFSLIVKLYETENAVITSQTEKVVEIFAGVFTKEFERVKLVSEATLGREENLDRLKQFPNDEIREKVVGLLRFLDTKYAGVVSSNEVLKTVI